MAVLNSFRAENVRVIREHLMIDLPSATQTDPAAVNMALDHSECRAYAWSFVACNSFESRHTSSAD